MDIARPTNTRRARIRRALYGAAAALAVLLVGFGFSRLKPAAPAVDRATVWVDSVKRGPMVRQVRGLGTLVAEDIRWVPATTIGRVERIRLRPGSVVEPDTVILDLSNPQLEQELQAAVLKVTGAEAALESLRVTIQNDRLAQQAQTAAIESDFKKAEMQTNANRQLADKGLVAGITLQQSQVDSEQLAARFEISRRQLDSYADTTRARVAVQQAELDQARSIMELKQRQFNELHVRAGSGGVLQVVPVDVGQQVALGTNLARVANPLQLKAELKIPETQAKDIQPGQAASVDTRNGIVEGKVTRVDPSVQNGTVTIDIRMTGPLPKGARPDLSVDGTIEIERLNDVLSIGRPALGQEQAVIALFKLGATSEAVRVQVKLGRGSVDRIEVLEGLNGGDHVILSDMSSWDAFERIRLQ